MDMTEILEYLDKVRSEKENGCEYHYPLSKTHEYIEFLISEVYTKDARIAKLERVILEDRISRFDEECKK